MNCIYCEHQIDVYEEYWDFEDIIVCEMCLDSFFDELINACRKVNEQDIDNEVEEMMLERGE